MLYPVIIRFNRSRHVFFYQNEDNPSYISPFGFKPYLTNASEQLICKKYKKFTYINMSYEICTTEAFAFFNLDLLFRRIRNMNSKHSCSMRLCKLVIDSWNFLDDLIITINAQAIQGNLYYDNKIILDDIYDKMYRGLNIFPYTNAQGDHFIYKPCLSKSEIQLLTQYLNHIGKSIFAKIFNFDNKNRF